MPESFLNNAQLTGLSADARRTEIMRAKGIAALDTRVTAVESLTDPTTWTAVTFTNSWVNYGSGRQAAQYRKIGDIVYLRGQIKNGTNNNTAFTLPAGFRPPANDYRVIISSSSGTPLPAFLYIQTSGAVGVYAGTTLDVGIGCSFSVTA